MIIFSISKAYSSSSSKNSFEISSEVSQTSETSTILITDSFLESETEFRKKTPSALFSQEF
jgi:hypothetical protein